MIIKSNQWRNYKNNKKRTYNETTYMETVEKVVRDYIAFLKLTDKVRLIIGEQYRVNYNKVNGIFTLEVPINKIETVIMSDMEFLEVATNIGHEISHIKHRDSVMFGWFVHALNWNKYNRVFNTLVETRADMFSLYLSQTLYSGHSYNWFQKETDYKKSGYFDGYTRLFLISNFLNYDEKVVKYIFENIYGKDKYMTIKELVVKVEQEKNKEKQKWLSDLLCIK
jgi:hypothetical protein